MCCVGRHKAQFQTLGQTPSIKRTRKKNIFFQPFPFIPFLTIYRSQSPLNCRFYHSCSKVLHKTLVMCELCMCVLCITLQINIMNFRWQSPNAGQMNWIIYSLKYVKRIFLFICVYIYIFKVWRNTKMHQYNGWYEYKLFTQYTPMLLILWVSNYTMLLEYTYFIYVCRIDGWSRKVQIHTNNAILIPFA